LLPLLTPPYVPKDILVFIEPNRRFIGSYSVQVSNMYGFFNEHKPKIRIVPYRSTIDPHDVLVHTYALTFPLKSPGNLLTRKYDAMESVGYNVPRPRNGSLNRVELFKETTHFFLLYYG